MKTLITCHANADCDAFAAMLAARHLYHGADLLFPGTQEPGLNSIYSNLNQEQYNFIDLQKINWDDYNKLILVDTRQAGRVQHVAPLLQKPEIHLEIWDHHPPASDDLHGYLHFAQSGAVTSLLCHELDRMGISLTGEEATLLGLGIYADTGSFTFSSTTEADFRAASWLLRHGMDVTRLNDLACHELTSMHVKALNRLLESATSYHFNETEVVLAEASMKDYMGDFAFLAHKLMEMEKFPVLFAIGLMNDRVQVVARSRSSAINVGKICAALGGGGHEYAASASIRLKSVHDVSEEILCQLKAQAQPEKTARDYMSAPAIGMESTGTIQKADELMLHFGLKAIPVFEPGTRFCIGILDGQTAARATAHGLGSQPVLAYMERNIKTLGPNATIRDLANAIIGGRQRLVPILEDNEIAGVVTRTDLMNVFAKDLDDSGNKDLKQRSVAKQLNERLDAETKGMLKLAGRLGANLKMPVYAVGGFVRDLLIGYPNKDIDLVVEGNGIAFAQALAHELGGRIRVHPEFLTSVVIYHDASGQERRLDVATSRLEYYQSPAALPTVEHSSIKMDLFRRDFTINALAVRLDGNFYGELADFFGGKRDIKDKVIRVLHTLSFVEDPTRVIRAIRFEQRYKFKLGGNTEKLIKNMLPMRLLEKLSRHRVFNEYRHLCDEERASACFERLDGMGILKALGPHLVLTPPKKALLKQLQEIMAWYRLLFFEEKPQTWFCYFLALSFGLSYADAAENYKSLGLPEGKRAEILRQREKLRSLKNKLLEWQKNECQGQTDVSAFCELMAGLSLETLLFSMAALDNPGLEKNISRYITTWSKEKADITGHDLMNLGIEPGPIYSVLLKKALQAKLNGKATNAKAQLAIAREAWANARENA